MDCQSKQEREEAAMIQVGGGKKHKGKKQKKVEYEDIFSLDVVIIQKFGLIQISPPTDAPDLDKKLTEIIEKKKWYEENGESAMKEKIKEMQLSIKLQEAQELERREKESTQVQEEERPRRGGRGGRGRGANYGDRSNYDERPRRGADRGGRTNDSYRQRSEFEADDDDVAYAAPRRPEAKKNAKQTKADLEKNEDNYPTL
jgi:hypothetical protein